MVAPWAHPRCQSAVEAGPENEQEDGAYHGGHVRGVGCSILGVAGTGGHRSQNKRSSQAIISAKRMDGDAAAYVQSAKHLRM